MDVCLRLALIEAGLSYTEYLALKKTNLRKPSQFAAVMARELPATVTQLSWTAGSMFPFKFDEVEDWDVRALDGLEPYAALELLHLEYSRLDSIEPLAGLGALALVSVKVTDRADLAPLLALPGLKRVSVESAATPAQKEVLLALAKRGVQVDGVRLEAQTPSSSPFEDSMLTLAVLNHLSGEGLVELPKVYFFDEYSFDHENLARLERVVMTQEHLDTIEELTWSGGGYTVQHLVWAQWDGESDEFDIQSLAGIEALRRLRVLRVSPLAAIPDDQLEALRARGVTVKEA